MTRGKIYKLIHALPRKRGKPVAIHNLHITLAFLGAVDAKQQACLQEQARNVSGTPFKLVLTQLGYFPKSQVIWLGLAHCPEPLQSLANALNLGVNACGFSSDPRPFSPHLTLFRKAVPAPTSPTITPVEWPIDSFYLVESKTLPQGAEYRVLQRFPLSDAGLQG